MKKQEQVKKNTPPKYLNFVSICNDFCAHMGGGWVGNGEMFFSVVSAFLDELRDKILDYSILLQYDKTTADEVRKFYLDKCDKFFERVKANND